MNPPNSRSMFPNRPEPPEGTLCVRCQEPIGANDQYFVNEDGSGAMHHECFVRCAIGGLNCQLGQCPCFGGNEPPDPDKLTARQSSKAAMDIWTLLNKQERRGEKSEETLRLLNCSRSRGLPDERNLQEDDEDDELELESDASGDPLPHQDEPICFDLLRTMFRGFWPRKK